MTKFIDGLRFVPNTGRMSRKTRAKPTLIGLIFGAALPMAATAAEDHNTLALDFATCLGRYAAQEDYDRLMGRDVALASARAAMFGELLDAISPTEQEATRALYKSRKGAEGAHWTLLHSADFSFDARLARHAQDTARRNIRMCEMLVLG